MARGTLNQLMFYGLGFGVAYTLYGLAYTGALGSGPEEFARQLKSAWGDTPGKVVGLVPDSSGGKPAATPAKQVSTSGSQSTATAGWQPTSLMDLGQVPVDYNAATGELKQRSSWVARYAPGYPENRYSSGVFFDSSGGQIVYQGSGQFRDSGGRLLASSAFIAAV